MRKFQTGLALFMLGAPGLAHATSVQTVTFTGLPPIPGASVWVEDGITATAGSGPLAHFSHADAAHLDGAAFPFTSFIDFTTGSLFDPLSIDVRPAGSGYCGPGSSDCNDPIDYIGVTGFLDDTVVASIGFHRPAGASFETILLDQLPSLDRLRIQARTFLDLGLPGSCNITAGCGHFDLDNVSLRAVAPAIPEPGAIGLFAIGLLCAAYARGRTA